MIRFACPTCGADLAAAAPYELGECDRCGASCYAPDAPLGVARRRERPAAAPPRGGLSPGGCLMLLLLLAGLGAGVFAAAFPEEFGAALRWLGERLESQTRGG